MWDVGANVGLFAFAASGSAGKSGRVLALEPDAWLVGLLHESASKRSDAEARVDVLPLAVSDRVEVSELKLSARGRAVNFLESGSSQSGGIRGVQSVLVVSLDWVLGFYPTPDVLKIDVEGAELAVLRGAETLLRTKRPKYFAK